MGKNRRKTGSSGDGNSDLGAPKEKSSLTSKMGISYKTLPVLDDKAYAGIVRDFVQLATRNSEADPVAVLVSFLVRLSVEIGKGPYFMVGDSKHFLNLFAVLVGRSAKARKGTSYGPVERLFKSLQEIDGSYEPSMVKPGPLSSGEGLIDAVRDCVEEFDKKKQVFVTKDPGVEDKRLFIISEELAGALIVMKKEGNILSVVFRSFWDHGNAAPMTKHNKIKSTGAHVGIVAHITCEELIYRLNNTEISNGFANRFLWFHIQRQKLVPHPKPMPNAKLLGLAKRLMKILSFAQSVDEMKMSISAKKYWTTKYPELTREDSGKIGVINNRLEAQAVRVAMLYALIDKSELIRKRHLVSALAVIDYSRTSVAYIFSDTQSDPVAEKLINALQKAMPKALSRTQIMRDVFQNNKSSADLTDILNQLALGGVIKKKVKSPKSGKGRATTTYSLVEMKT